MVTHVRPAPATRSLLPVASPDQGLDPRFAFQWNFSNGAGPASRPMKFVRVEGAADDSSELYIFDEDYAHSLPRASSDYSPEKDNPAPSTVRRQAAPTAPPRPAHGMGVLVTPGGLLMGKCDIPEGKRARFGEGIFFKFPSQAGETYDMNAYLREFLEGVDLGSAEFPVAIHLENIETAFGEKSAWVYEATGRQGSETFPMRWYWVEGLGLVRSENDDRPGEIREMRVATQTGEQEASHPADPLPPPPPVPPPPGGLP